MSTYTIIICLDPSPVKYDCWTTDQITTNQSLYISLVRPHGVEHAAQVLHRISEGQARQCDSIRQHVLSEGPHDLHVSLQGI